MNSVLAKLEGLDYFVFRDNYLWRIPPDNQLDFVNEVSFFNNAVRRFSVTGLEPES
jgi:hypothetical protein